MKLGAAWYGFREQTATNYFEMAAGLGLKYVEVPLYWQIIEDNPGRFKYGSLTAIGDLKTQAQQAGVRMVSSVSEFSLAGSMNIRGDAVDPGEAEFALAAARRVIDIGAQLGLDVLRITEPNINPDDIDRARPYMEAYGKAMGTLGDYASERGVRIVAENYGLTSAQVNWLLDAADHPNVGTLYDPCNYHRIGEDPLSALKNLGHRVTYCHLKDAFRNDPRDPTTLFAGSRWPPSVAVGAGEINWGPILAEMATFYDGYLCIEYEMAQDVMHGTRSSIAHIRQVAAQHHVDIEI